VSAGALGSGIFGFINRLLIPTGLHQVLNTIAWFQIGEFTNAAGAVFHGDINRFYAGDGTAGMFMSGFFPIMMFGLPGAALAMYLAAPKARRPMVGGMLLSVAITAFLTGVTEPLEFLFMFLAP
ncbi:PTS transporter subunit EIIC, partial [Pseudomonas aeruginosa]|nr:PTS transporter subunit EIIC [Pseudomonas aeruginosa]